LTATNRPLAGGLKFTVITGPELPLGIVLHVRPDVELLCTDAAVGPTQTLAPSKRLLQQSCRL
tara:strand:+ start:3205 stop:3393 length:189 start_codon:yes stop_codon:yes gene_type:complete